MEERRTKTFWKTKFTFPFLIMSMVWVFLFSLLGFFTFLNNVASLQHACQYSFAWRASFILFVLTLAVTIFFIFVIMFIFLFRTVGAIPRIEKILEKIINGNYALRVTVRKKDTINSFIEKLNKILDLLEQKSKN